jgi:hypothetical protein
MKCSVSGCNHQGGLTIDPKNIEKGSIRLCFHHMMESFNNYMRSYYKMEYP